MKHEAGSALRNAGCDASAEALLAQQVATHRANMPWANAGSAFAAFVLTTLQWAAVPAAALWSWLALLAGVLLLRTALAALAPDGASEVALHRVWIWRFRAAFLIHGLAWGAASLLPLAGGDALHMSALVVILSGVTASSFVLTAFDLRSAMFFGVPVLGLLSLRLFGQDDPTYWLLGVAVIGVLVFLSLAARRAQRVVREYVELRLSEAGQAEALRHSEELLERTGATAGVGGWEFDPSTRALRLTTQVFRIHDIESTDRPDLDVFFALYGASQQADLRAAVDATTRQGTPFDLALPLRTAAGRERWVRIIGEARSPHGAGANLRGVVQDITKFKAAEAALAENNHLLTLLVQTTREGIWTIDNDAVTTDVNPAMCEILGRPREDIIGRSIFAFVDEANKAVFKEQVARRAQGAAGGYQIALTRPGGAQVDCFNNATTIFDASGRRVGAIGLFADISEQKHAEKTLRATSDELARQTHSLQLTLNSIAQGIVSVDADGRILVHNRRVAELLDLPDSLLAPGTTYDDVVRFQVQRGDLAADTSFVDADRRFRHFADGGINSPDVHVRRARSGALIEVRTRLLPDGGMVRTFADVTAYINAQRAVREREAEVQALLDAFPGFIAVLDEDFSYTYVNDRFAALFGRSRAEVIGLPAQEILHPDRLERLKERALLTRIGEPMTVETEYQVGVDQPTVYLQVTQSLGVNDGAGRQKIYAFAIDISARKVAEQALLAAKEEAERANLAKSQFLSSMSHELRTPLNAILGFGQLLVSDPTHPLADHQRAQAHEILRGGRHLLSLINEVLDLALVETGKLQVTLAPVGVSQLLHECLGLLQPLTRPAGIEVQVLDNPACTAFVLADRTRLKQVLLNLLSNAIKYNRVGGGVRIACTASDGFLRVGLSDDGPGIGPDQGARLFEAFERLGAGQTGIEGAGLGLALSKRFMQAMGGSIGLESEAGQGSTFWIELPLAAAPAAEVERPLPVAAAPASLASGSGLRKVLYIEDNPINVLLMEAMLSRVPNLQLLIAPLPELGLRMALDDCPDLILLDIQMPGMDGYEVLRRLRLGSACRTVPVIAVSANAMASDVEQGLAAGFVQYLTKPLDMPLLLAAVERALAAG
ncbi:MAG: PAS domain S-box protein [Rhizobacter sp.]|nr:PAS domain S-box protein [Rhizobacter sp.]